MLDIRPVRRDGLGRIAAQTNRSRYSVSPAVGRIAPVDASPGASSLQGKPRRAGEPVELSELIHPTPLAP